MGKHVDIKTLIEMYASSFDTGVADAVRKLGEITTLVNIRHELREYGRPSEVQRESLVVDAITYYLFGE